MESFDMDGRISYRTKKLMPLERAAQWARCLSANERFCDVEIRTSKRAKSPDVKHFVAWVPSNPERVQEMLDRQQDARTERASTQAFTFALDPSGAYIHCLSHESGETYELDLQARTCNCPDQEIRLRDTGLRCKHRIACRAAIDRGEVGEFTITPKAAARFGDQQRFEEIYDAADQDWLK